MIKRYGDFVECDNETINIKKCIGFRISHCCENNIVFYFNNDHVTYWCFETEDDCIYAYNQLLRIIE